MPRLTKLKIGSYYPNKGNNKLISVKNARKGIWPNLQWLNFRNKNIMQMQI